MKKRGPKILSPEQKRVYTVSVRLNESEMRLLNLQRNKIQKGEFLRLSFLNSAPPVVPEINQNLYFELSKCAGSLATVAAEMRSGGFVQLTEIENLIKNFRLLLITSTPSKPAKRGVKIPPIEESKEGGEK